MTDKKLNSSEEQKKQWITLLMLLIGAVIVCIALAIMMRHRNGDSSLTMTNTPKFDSGLSKVNDGPIMLERAQQEAQQAEQKAEKIEQELATQNQTQVQENAKLQQRLEEMETLLRAKQEHVDPLAPKQLIDTAPVLRIREDTIEVSSNNDTTITQPTKNPETYVPTGTFVKAIMIGGADASASVNTQANPTPMLFKIIENGTLPNKQHSHLKDCFVTAAVVGDISSERGMIRLENISCTFPNNEIVDQVVEGTVFGPEGKNGVRGIPVWREKALLQRAFAAGALSGLSDGLSQSSTTNSISALGNTQTIDTGQVFKYGATAGIGKAMDKLADYNIRRAEQYHPVIQISAGTMVDVVFLKGFYLDGKSHSGNNAIAPTELFNNAGQTYPPVANQSLPLTPQQVMQLQQKTKELSLHATTAPTQEFPQ